MKNRKYTEIKYKIAWNIGAMFSFFLYFSGIAHCYILLRKKLLKNYIMFVLTYHRIHDGREDAHISVRVETFKRQMAYLQRSFNVISLDALINSLGNSGCLTNDVVAITFDDGWKDNYNNAFQVLKVTGFPATIFVATDRIGKDHGLTDEEINEMFRNNVTIGAHTMSHKALSDVDYETAVSEVRGSKLKLEKILQQEVKYFAYPFGKKGQDFSEQAMDIVKESRFTAAFSTDNGCVSGQSHLFALERIGIRDFPMFVFKVRVSGIFENKWVHSLRQYLRV
ncbi:MAG: polysaccharide deacetylase family protein [Nitrospirae bacterium]|nr:polysaccharide deacetylase family protein [Nitrospirota bacterium]